MVDETQNCRLNFNAPVTQWIEYLPSKQNVIGSNPIGRTTL